MTKWNTTANINTGCNKNCTNGFVPIKCEASLNASALITDSKFMVGVVLKKH